MIFDERIENAKRILTQNSLSEQHPVADAAYVIRYLRYIGESEEKILKTYQQALCVEVLCSEQTRYVEIL